VCVVVSSGTRVVDRQAALFAFRPSGGRGLTGGEACLGSHRTRRVSSLRDACGHRDVCVAPCSVGRGERGAYRMVLRWALEGMDS
jgi:hypothetical protein